MTSSASPGRLVRRVVAAAAATDDIVDNDAENDENAAATHTSNKRQRNCAATINTTSSSIGAADAPSQQPGPAGGGGATAEIQIHPSRSSVASSRYSPLSRMTLYSQTNHCTLTADTATREYAAHDLYTLYDHYQLVYLPAKPPPSPSPPPQPQCSPLPSQLSDDKDEEEEEGPSSSSLPRPPPAPAQKSPPLLPILTPHAIPQLFTTLHVDDQHSGVVENSGRLDRHTRCRREIEGTEEVQKPSPETAKEEEKEVSGVQIGPYLTRYCGDGDVDDGTKNRNTKKNPTEKVERGYCSFIVSKTTDRDVYNTLLQRLPLKRLPLTTIDSSIPTRQLQHGPCVWFFVGRNDRNNNGDSNTPPLPGRPEHTDAISHNGTWHYQLAGGKIWTVRPTEELLQHWKKQTKAGEAVVSTASFDIHCHTGDVLLINTRLWWHATSIPSGGGGARGGQRGILLNDKNKKQKNGPSISYARDVYWDDDPSKIGEVEGASTTEEAAGSSSRIRTMTNLDGLYAANDIPSGTILFRETTMPDCELHRSAVDYNCEVVELEEEDDAEEAAVLGHGNEEEEDNTSADDAELGNGRMAVVSCRAIKAGEFFCLMESSDEEEDDDDVEEEEEDEDGFVEWRSAEDDDAEEEE